MCCAASWALLASSSPTTSRWRSASISPSRRPSFAPSRPGLSVLLFLNTAKARASLADEVRAIVVAKAKAEPAFRRKSKTACARIVALKARIGT